MSTPVMREPLTHILSIDPSPDPSKVGWACFIWSRSPVGEYLLQRYGVLQDPAKRHPLIRWCDVLVIEGQFYHKNIKTLMALVEARCLWSVPAYDLGKEVSLVHPTQWVRHIMNDTSWGRQKTNPKVIEKIVKKRWGLTKTHMEEDTISAIAMGTYWYDQQRGTSRWMRKK